MADGDMKLAPLIQQASELAIPVIVLGEYQYGIRLSRHRTQYESWLNGLLLTCRLLVVDERTASLYADIRHKLKRTGHPIPENDIWIAALARQHNSPLVTRDQHFDFVPSLTRLNW
jgi:predicted nucleic acid-binding protein